MIRAAFDPHTDRYTQGIIRRKVRQLVGRAGFRRQDQEALRQELLTRVVQSLPTYCPDRGHRKVFVTAVVERHVATMLRNKQSPKREHEGVISLSVRIETPEDGRCELGETIGQAELDNRLGLTRRSPHDLVDLALDMQSVIARLPEKWQDLLERRKTQSMTTIARDLRIPRTTLHEWMRHIRARFEEAGMRDYLQT
jgi:RNA polymerase sigma-70 factor (ECF subfamily)